MIPCVVLFGAGLNFTSSQDHPAGDALTATAADPSAHLASLIIAAPFVVWICLKFGSLLLSTLRANLALKPFAYLGRTIDCLVAGSRSLRL